MVGRTIESMTQALFDRRGNRKYFIAGERLAFVYAASKEREALSALCLTMAFTGARISEVLALTANRIDAADEAIIFETLKQKKKRIFRAVPVPWALIPLLSVYGVGREGRLWPRERTNGRKAVKSAMREAGVVEGLCKPKALRHAFAVEAGQKSILLNIMQRWLGRARPFRRHFGMSESIDEHRPGTASDDIVLHFIPINGDHGRLAGWSCPHDL